MRISQRITIVRISRPVKKNLNEELQWLGSSLGLFGLRDKDKSCFRIFIELLKSAKSREPMTSDQLANKLHLSRGTVVHHLNKLMDSGIVVAYRNRYTLRVENLEALISELRKDLKRTIDDLSEVAEDVDKWLGL